ncbi:hypothetical protein BAUCODRAFT_151283 [Baudoinia panamericana UAMH 10762]|uniref:Uncharacterized protein n=1 Tax=Baudoinia panamericana (strain UAMH 10762) TaxID=717646 RepID=M2N2J7_BAUPA|nr:uncharacterized protein BAUCODRAFT_151283 [Baudoinia panamericana UAMH 10762]EMC92890.1 hypothetical protein BAUCODRAFT_151283 [Baudoinia panamericana UAMH 10762]
MVTRGIGSHCIWMFKGKEWPILICGDDILPKDFFGRRRHSDEVAAILLGLRKYIWILECSLQDIDPHRKYLEPSFSDEPCAADDETAKLEKHRRIAFEQDLQLWGTPKFWKNYIAGERKARRLQRSISTSSRGKRKRSTNSAETAVSSGRSSNDADTHPSTSSHKRRRCDSSGSLPNPQTTSVRGGSSIGRKKGGCTVADVDGIVDTDDLVRSVEQEVHDHHDKIQHDV